MKILIADDDAIPRRLLQAALVKAGHDVVVARDGAEAWQLLQGTEAPRLAILDWLMPGLDGIGLCRQIRQQEKAPYVYVILLTAKDQHEDIIAGLAAGADDYLTKPFDPQELEVRLRAGQRILDLQAALLASLKELAQARQREAEIGARIQHTLLFGQPPQELLGARLAVLTMPSQAIDGDFYDFFQHTPRCLDLVIGDVMGKGVPAALLGAAIKSAPLRALSRLLAVSRQGALPEPEDIVQLVHHDVTGQFINLGVFVTMCYARLDLEHGRLTLVDCGHTQTVHYRQRTNTCAFLQGENMPLGFSEEERYRQEVFPLAAGDVVVFYSDGVTEARNAAGAFFGAERLLEVVQAHHTLEPAQLIDVIRQAVLQFSGVDTCADDLTCVVLTISPPEPEAPLAQVQYEASSLTSELLPLRLFVRRFCQALPEGGLDEEGLCQLELAVTEAASNIMRHAYQGRADQRLRVVAEAYADRIVVRLLHRGVPFDPGTVKPPAFDSSHDGGFGLYIIAHTVDEVRYSRDAHGENGICLVKKRLRR